MAAITISPSAADKVFAVPELFDMIVVQLPLPDIIRSRRVNLNWKEYIDADFLQQVLFLQAHPATYVEHAFLIGQTHRDASLAKVTQRVSTAGLNPQLKHCLQVTHNPLVWTQEPVVFEERENHRASLDRRAWDGEHLVLRPEIFTILSRHDIAQPQLLLDTFLTQPPTTAAGRLDPPGALPPPPRIVKGRVLPPGPRLDNQGVPFTNPAGLRLRDYIASLATYYLNSRAHPLLSLATPADLVRETCALALQSHTAGGDFCVSLKGAGRIAGVLIAGREDDALLARRAGEVGALPPGFERRRLEWALSARLTGGM